MNAATMTPADALNWALMNAVAKRIARASASDPDSARADYAAHAAAMDADEVTIFDRTIVEYVIEMGG